MEDLVEVLLSQLVVGGGDDGDGGGDDLVDVHGRSINLFSESESPESPESPESSGGDDDEEEDGKRLLRDALSLSSSSSSQQQQPPREEVDVERSSDDDDGGGGGVGKKNAIRVGLYFASPESEPLCEEFEFMIPQYMQALRESDQTICLVYVGCGGIGGSIGTSGGRTKTAAGNNDGYIYTLDDQLRRMKELGIGVGIKVGSRTSIELQRRYKIWPNKYHDEFIIGIGNGNNGIIGTGGEDDTCESDDAVVVVNGKDPTARTTSQQQQVQYAVRPDVMDEPVSGDAAVEKAAAAAAAAATAASTEKAGTKSQQPKKTTETIVRRSDLVQDLEGRTCGVPAIIVLKTSPEEEEEDEDDDPPATAAATTTTEEETNPSSSFLLLDVEKDGISALADWPVDDADGIFYI